MTWLQRYRLSSFVRSSVWLPPSNVFCIGLFIYMLDDVGKSLRPVSVLTRVGNAGQEVIREVYPSPVSRTEDPPSHVGAAPSHATSRTIASRHTGAVLAFDETGLAELARRADGLIELAPQVGDFVTRGDSLRSASSWISLPRRSHRRSTTRLRPCWRSTRLIACLERWPSGV